MKHVAAALLAALALASCSGHAQRAAGTLVIDQQREPISLNPALENGVASAEISSLVFSYLVKMNDRGELVGDAAEVVPTLHNGGISADGRTIVYHLRRGIRFSDGQPLTADDCAFSVDAILNAANNVQTRYGYDRIARAEARGPYTFVVHLREPFAPLLTLVMGPQGFPILPKHVLGALHDFNHIPFNDSPIGSGPYRIREWHHGDSVILDANDAYFGGKPHVPHLELRFVGDANTAMNQLRTGESDFFFNDENMGDFPTLQAIPNIVVQRPAAHAVGAIIFNTSDAVTGAGDVRRALALAIDVPVLVRKSYRGAVDSTGAGRGLFEWAYSPDALPDARSDPAAARVLLDRAGWATGSDGIRRKNGTPLDVLFIMQAHTAGDETVGSAIREYERAIGVGITLKAFNATQFAAPSESGGPVYGGRFQMALYPFTNGDDPDVTDQFSCAAVPPRGYNKSRFCDPRFDLLLASARQTYDSARRRVLYDRIERVVADRMPLLLLYQRRQIDAMTVRLHGVTVTPSATGPFWNVAHWSLNRST